MRVLRWSPTRPATLVGCQGWVWVLGHLDGLHAGHRALCEQAADLARRLQAPGWGVLSFEPPPKIWFIARSQGGRTRDLSRLTTVAEKTGVLARWGCDGLLLCDFSRAASLGATAFLDQVVQSLQPAAWVVGENFRFGHRRAGDTTTLQRFGATHGVTCKVVPLLNVDGEVLSSSRCREALHAQRLSDVVAWWQRPLAWRCRLAPTGQLSRSHPWPLPSAAYPVVVRGEQGAFEATWTLRRGQSSLEQSTNLVKKLTTSWVHPGLVTVEHVV